MLYICSVFERVDRKDNRSPLPKIFYRAKRPQ